MFKKIIHIVIDSKYRNYTHNLLKLPIISLDDKQEVITKIIGF